MSQAPVPLRVQYQDAERQSRAAETGMWVFLGSELLFFSGLFLLYAAFAARYTREFHEAARHSTVIIGSVNTLILLTSSLAVALAVVIVRSGGSPRRARAWLLAAASLGGVFLVLKGAEYAIHLSEGIAPGAAFHQAELSGAGHRLFFSLYYVMTGIHAVHVGIGIGLLLWLARDTGRRRFSPEYKTPLELGGLYWHFVDLVWVFLWPMFYLLR